MGRNPLRDRDSALPRLLGALALGALAGFAIGVALAHRSGGLDGLRRRVRGGSLRQPTLADEELHAHTDSHPADADGELEAAVLDAFRMADVLKERPIDIGAAGAGVIELSGWVESESVSQRAADLARSVSGVVTVVNRLTIGTPDAPDERNEALD